MVIDHCKARQTGCSLQSTKIKLYNISKCVLKWDELYIYIYENIYRSAQARPVVSLVAVAVANSFRGAKAFSLSHIYSSSLSPLSILSIPPCRPLLPRFWGWRGVDQYVKIESDAIACNSPYTHIFLSIHRFSPLFSTTQPSYWSSPSERPSHIYPSHIYSLLCILHSNIQNFYLSHSQIHEIYMF